MTHKAGIVGHTGYSGAELVRILARHPHVQTVLMDHREDAGGAAAIRSGARPERIACTAEAARGEGLSVVFLATPPEVSVELAPVMLQAWARLMELSCGLRLRTPEN